MIDLSCNEQGLSSMNRPSDGDLPVFSRVGLLGFVSWQASCRRGRPVLRPQVCVKSGFLTGLTGAVVGSLEGDRLLIAIESDQHALLLAIDQTAIDVAQAMP